MGYFSMNNPISLSMRKIVESLAYLDVFCKLPHDILVQLTNQAVIRKLEKGEFLFHQGDVWPNVIYIDSGELDWTLLSINGNEFVLFSLGAKDIFWGHSMFDDQRMPASLIATKNSVIYIWHRENILPYLYKYPDAMWDVTKILTRKMREAREIIYSLTFQKVPQRLARLLLEYFSDPDVTKVKRNLTLRSIAIRISSSSEVVCRIFQRMECDGIIELTREYIILEDRAALEKLAYSEKQ